MFKCLFEVFTNTTGNETNVVGLILLNFYIILYASLVFEYSIYVNFFSASNLLPDGSWISQPAFLTCAPPNTLSETEGNVCISSKPLPPTIIRDGKGKLK